jgi:iron complex transport system substrate-binding protein
MKQILCLLLSSFLFPLSSLSLAQYPRTLTDDLGRSITIKSEPKRIITMFPSVTETVCAMGACGRLIASDTYSDWPETAKKLPKVGGLYDPNPELIVSLKPDLVLLSVYGKLQEVLEKAGIVTFAIKTESYEDIFRTARLLGQVLNLRSEAERLVSRVQSEIYAVESKAAKTSERPSVYYEIDPTPYSVGPDSFIGVLIAKARGQNIVPKELGPFPQVNPELVVQKNPAIIILTHPGEADLKKRPGWAGIKAVQTNRLCSFVGEGDNLLSRPGPRVAEGLKLLVACLHP